MRGRDLMPPLPESLRLWIVCEGMRWTHLPNGGGLYDQHPKLLDEWEYIFRRVARHREEEQRRREEEANRKARRNRLSA